MIDKEVYSNWSSETSRGSELPPMLINDNLDYFLDDVSSRIMGDSLQIYPPDTFFRNFNPSGSNFPPLAANRTIPPGDTPLHSAWWFIVTGKPPFFVFHMPSAATTMESVQYKFKTRAWIDKAENSSINNETSSRVSDSLVRGEMAQIFRESANEVFETGMDNKFRQRIKSMLNNYSRPTIDTLSEWLQGGVMDVELLSESLRSVGASRDESTMEMRLELLVTALGHPSPIVRDSAIISLSDLANPMAIPYLKDALKKEKILSLRNDMISVLEELNGDEHAVKKT